MVKIKKKKKLTTFVPTRVLNIGFKKNIGYISFFRHFYILQFLILGTDYPENKILFFFVFDSLPTKTKKRQKSSI